MVPPLPDNLSQGIAAADVVEVEKERLAAVDFVAEEHTENMKVAAY